MYVFRSFSIANFRASATGGFRIPFYAGKFYESLEQNVDVRNLNGSVLLLISDDSQ